MTTITLPWPASTNRYRRTWKGRVLVSKEGREYRQMIVRMALVHKFPRFGSARVRVVIEASAPDRRRRDIDNLYKGLLDAMQSPRRHLSQSSESPFEEKYMRRSQRLFSVIVSRQITRSFRQSV